ncbi:hypothetical protein QBC35DRAFT_503307 [Podospora australis]|uniref:Uncharacterized protein n=1 Tax=Podospora australis TaxID=1536484 RepID=A0AAN6WQ12_9PEZI|nr:hypothetical protein QBC35DRAFT_503307 [Podospora australis]
MPSLESVGLGNEILRNMTLEEIKNLGTHLVSRAFSLVEAPLLKKRLDPFCVPGFQAEQSCALSCILYLNSLGTTQCTAWQGPYNPWCQTRRSGSAGGSIAGAPVSSSISSASSWCSHVALGASWVTNNPACFQGDNDCGSSFTCVGGVAAAYGNGDLLVKVYGGAWS